MTIYSITSEPSNKKSFESSGWQKNILNCAGHYGLVPFFAVPPFAGRILKQKRAEPQMQNEALFHTGLSHLLLLLLLLFV